MWYVCDLLYTVLYVRVNCFIMRRCVVLIDEVYNICNSDVFSVLICILTI